MALARLQQEEVLRVAEIDGLVQCPFCDYAAICGPIEEDKEFRCQNPECMEISCRHCQKKTHIPLSCKEASKDDAIAVRHAVEEAMTQAMIRKCKYVLLSTLLTAGHRQMQCSRLEVQLLAV
jgi:TRIAD3 protein (E3 ubiquitin-protein ligase RNF216)